MGLHIRHTDLGNIGRIRLKGTGSNTMINLDVIGDPNDPMTAKRRKIFEPIGMDIANQMESVVGAGTEKPLPTPMPTQDKTLVKSQIMQCEKCDVYVAVLIFADNAWSPDREAFRLSNMLKMVCWPYLSPAIVAATLPATKHNIVGFASLAAACEKQAHKRQHDNQSDVTSFHLCPFLRHR